jgi:hypothetical protein
MAGALSALASLSSGPGDINSADSRISNSRNRDVDASKELAKRSEALACYGVKSDPVAVSRDCGITPVSGARVLFGRRSGQKHAAPSSAGTCNQTVMSGEYRPPPLIFLQFCLISIAFVALRSRRFWCETGAVPRRHVLAAPRRRWLRLAFSLVVLSPSTCEKSLAKRV